jgi:hypothetical protein
MTDQELLDVYLANQPQSHAAGLRGVWNAGYYHGAGLTPSANAPDRSGTGVSKPVAVLRIRKD